LTDSLRDAISAYTNANAQVEIHAAQISSLDHKVKSLTLELQTATGANQQLKMGLEMEISSLMSQMKALENDNELLRGAISENEAEEEIVRI
jgi:chromosome segregation ATPase